MIYVYAILEGASVDAGDSRGIDGQPVWFVQRGNLTVACTRHEIARMAPTAQNVLGHERVVEQFMRHAVLLPTRFATTFDSEHALLDLLARHEPELIDALDRVRGCDELGVRVLRPPETERQVETPSHQSGREYLLRRSAQERIGADFDRRAQALHERLSTLARASSCRLLKTPASILSGAYLVVREDTGRFRESVNQLALENGDLRLLCTGPWPAYNFAPVLKPAEACHV